MEPLVRFWEAAVALDPAAASADERHRFPLCNLERLAALFRDTGLEQVRAEPLDLEVALADFHDYWGPFLGGTGPAPSYVASLDPLQRERLRESPAPAAGRGPAAPARSRPGGARAGPVTLPLPGRPAAP
jgi:hypothetical protein